MAKKSKKKGKPETKFSTQYTKLGKRIRELRKQRGYTSSLKFAFDNDLSHVQMARWEQGKNMNLDSLLRLAEAFKVSLADLVKDL